ncbi:MAG: DHHW family protein, partial [Oscillospiraceae bacterium]|nr:DHHW family protein [Oscillospiraceae bacterium]
TPGADATCTEPQTCTVCGEILVEATGHDVGSDGVCTKCGTRIVPEGQKYIAPGKNGAVSDDTSKIIPETQNTGHYNNNIDAYYAGAVLVCGDYSLEYFLPGAEGSSSYADIVNGFAEKYPNINTTCMLVPKSCAFNSPAGYTNPYERTQQFIDATYGMMNDSVKKADCLGVMTDHEGEYMFYRTDHHWTSLGAYYGSVAYCNANGIEPYALDTYETVVKTDFMGTLYGWAGSPSCLEANPDYTVGHYPHTGYSMVYKNGGDWYSGSAINANSKSYAGMFICGDQPLTVFTTANKNGKTLIIFKESYGNGFVPYMLDYYEQVVVVDIRKDTASVESIIEKYNVTDALIINNCQAAISLQPDLKAKVMS